MGSTGAVLSEDIGHRSRRFFLGNGRMIAGVLTSLPFIAVIGSNLALGLTGFGVARDARIYLQPGDRVTIRVDYLGVIDAELIR